MRTSFAQDFAGRRRSWPQARIWANARRQAHLQEHPASESDLGILCWAAPEHDWLNPLATLAIRQPHPKGAQVPCQHLHNPVNMIMSSRNALHSASLISIVTLETKHVRFTLTYCVKEPHRLAKFVAIVAGAVGGIRQDLLRRRQALRILPCLVLPGLQTCKCNHTLTICNISGKAETVSPECACLQQESPSRHMTV